MMSTDITLIVLLVLHVPPTSPASDPASEPNSGPKLDLDLTTHTPAPNFMRPLNPKHQLECVKEALQRKPCGQRPSKERPNPEIGNLNLGEVAREGATACHGCRTLSQGCRFLGACGRPRVTGLRCLVKSSCSLKIASGDGPKP